MVETLATSLTLQGKSCPLCDVGVADRALNANWQFATMERFG
jgi:hypothetical protein